MILESSLLDLIDLIVQRYRAFASWHVVTKTLIGTNSAIDYLSNELFLTWFYNLWFLYRLASNFSSP